MNPFMLGAIVGGFAAIYLLSSLFNWIVAKRVFSDPSHQIWASVGMAFAVSLLIRRYEGDLAGIMAIPYLVSGAVAAALVIMAKYYPLRKGGADFLRVSISAVMAFLLPGVVFYAMSPASASTAFADNQSDAAQPDQVSLNLRAMAAALNEDAPKMVDKHTKLLRATISGRVFTYHYKIMEARNVSDAVFLARIRAAVVPKVCANPDMRRDLDEDGVTYEYAYKVPGSREELVLSVDKAACLA